MDFEKSEKKLKEIVDKLDGNVTLKESIELFEDGVRISKECIDALTEARAKITVIRKKMDEIFEEPLGAREE